MFKDVVEFNSREAFILERPWNDVKIVHDVNLVCGIAIDVDVTGLWKQATAQIQLVAGDRLQDITVFALLRNVPDTAVKNPQ
jgi:hypothetical protein